MSHTTETLGRVHAPTSPPDDVLNPPVTGNDAGRTHPHPGATSHLVAGVSFTKEQLEQRRFTLGASEVPAVLGLDKYKGPFDVYASKKGLVQSFAGNEYTEWGLRMEPAIRGKAAEVLGVAIADGGSSLVHPIDTWMSATPDGFFEYDGARHILEMKNKTDRQAPLWGVSGTDEIPYDVGAQVHWQMEVTGVERAVVAVLLGKADFRLYHVRRDPEIAAAIVETCRQFWFEHVIADVPPSITASVAARDYLKERFALHGEALRDASRAEDGLIAELRDVKAQAKEIEAREEAIKNQLMQAIGSDAGLVGRAGRVTWKRANGMQVGWKDVAVALNAPQELIQQYSTPMGRKFLTSFPKE